MMEISDVHFFVVDCVVDLCFSVRLKYKRIQVS